MKKTIIILFIPLVLSLALAALITVRPKESTYSLDIKKINLSQYLVIDTRYEDDYKEAHITNAILANDINEILSIVRKNDNKLILLYCSAHCSYSRILTEKLRFKYKLKEIYYLKGGFEAWSNKSEGK